MNPPQLSKLVSNVEFCASYYSKITKSSIFSRSIEMYSVKEYEYSFIRAMDKKISIEDIDDFTSEVREAGDKVIKPDDQHKKTVLTCVMVSEKGIEDSVVKYTKKFKCEKCYRYYFHGWSEMRIVVVDLADDMVYHNERRGRFKKRVDSLYGIR